DRTVGALCRWVARLGGGAPRDHGSRKCVEVIEVYAGAEEAAGRPMNHVPVYEVGLNHDASAQLALNTGVKMLSLRRRKVMRVQRSERIGLLGKQNLRLLSSARELGILLRPQSGKLGEELAIPVRERERLEESAGKWLPGCRINHCSVAYKLPAAAPEHRTLSEPPPGKLRVVEDSRSCANDGPVVVPDRPRKSHRRLKVLIFLLCGTQVAAIDRRH